MKRSKGKLSSLSAAAMKVLLKKLCEDTLHQCASRNGYHNKFIIVEWNICEPDARIVSECAPVSLAIDRVRQLFPHPESIIAMILDFEEAEPDHCKILTILTDSDYQARVYVTTYGPAKERGRHVLNEG